uniref:Uncharacterized protein n=1 Tax=Vitis vinifera TaxID=29760 RepID=F6GY52_VITVI
MAKRVLGGGLMRLVGRKEANVYKVQKKQGIGGRKALGDLTNSRKPSPIKASKRHYSKIFTSFGEEVDAVRSK